MTIVDGQTAETSIQVTPLIGDGTLSLDVSWPTGTLDQPTVAGRLVDTAGGETLIDFTVSGLTATYSGAVPNGYYDLFIDLVGTNNRNWSHYTAVRIVEGQTTEGTLPLQLSQETGNLELSISVDLLNPVDITLVDVPATLYYGGTATVGAIAVPTDDGSYAYSWMLNGVVLTDEVNSAVNIGASQLIAGTNLLAARVSAGEVTSARTAAITYVDTLPSPAVSASNETTDTRPTWAWDAVPGAGAYRYGYTEGSWITETAADTTFTPTTDLTEGEHTLFVQVQDDRGTWSASGSATVSVVGNSAPSVESDPGDQSWD